MEENNNQRESIKLMKMSKGYQWEIKLLSGSIISQGHTITLTLGDKELTRLEEIDKKLREKYGDDSKQKEGDNKK